MQTLRSFSIISSMLTSPFWDTLLSMLVSHSQSSLYFSLKTVHSFSFSLTCCLRSDSCGRTAIHDKLTAPLCKAHKKCQRMHGNLKQKLIKIKKALKEAVQTLSFASRSERVLHFLCVQFIHCTQDATVKKRNHLEVSAFLN